MQGAAIVIYKRMVAHLRGQNWFAISVELAIVIVGVFIGTQVSNWNDERIARANTVQVLRGLKPELSGFVGNDIQRYYAVTRRYAATAFAGWRGDPGVSDRDFVLAAYQASQTNYSGRNIASWSQIVGGDQLRRLDDQRLRDDLTVLMTFDLSLAERELFTRYREEVRKVIPEDIQDAIRSKCGDKRFGPRGAMRLSPTCTLDLPDAQFRLAAQALRARPDLVGEMRWHFSAVATYLENLGNLVNTSKRVLHRIEKI